jgi:hypothetical protein
MKIFLLCLSSFLILSSATCKKTNSSTGTIHTGKVLYSLCGNIAVQFTDGASLGQVNWSNPSDTTHTPYSNVFRVANPCTWGGAQANSNIRFRFVPVAAQNCVQCMAYIATPDTAYNIQIVQ